MRMMDVYQGSFLRQRKHDCRRYRHSLLYSLPSQIQKYAERTATAIEGEEPKPQSREFTKSNAETRRCQLLFFDFYLNNNPHKQPSLQVRQDGQERKYDGQEREQGRYASEAGFEVSSRTREQDRAVYLGMAVRLFHS